MPVTSYAERSISKHNFFMRAEEIPVMMIFLFMAYLLLNLYLMRFRINSKMAENLTKDALPSSL